jgi:hypothetical protein
MQSWKEEFKSHKPRKFPAVDRKLFLVYGIRISALRELLHGMDQVHMYHVLT